MNRQVFLLALFIIIVFFKLSAQSKIQKRADIRVMFYNTENFFDTIDDPITNDNDFLPGSKNQWTGARYHRKLVNLYQVIAAVGEEKPPEIIGFAEVENRKVISDLIYKTALEKYPYKIIHQESPDQRGIDVALLYRSDVVRCINYGFIPIFFKGNKDKTTRDILYFKGLISGDTLHVFVNHWPSRRGGQKRSDPSRMHVANVLKHKIDSIFTINPNSKVIITGDFNDEPQDKSLSSGLGALGDINQLQSKALYNLSWVKKLNCNCGTYRLDNNWEMLDQFIVSGSLLVSGKLYTKPDFLHIGDLGFLLKEDKNYGGYRPFRTYQGPAYIGGFSDHLPVYLDLNFKP
jgi:predicted extracellular nuclease